MSEDELIVMADDACIFTNDLQVVPLKDAIRAIRAEREACARVCDGYVGLDPIADAIRMRSNAPELTRAEGVGVE